MSDTDPSCAGSHGLPIALLPIACLPMRQLQALTQGFDFAEPQAQRPTPSAAPAEALPAVPGAVAAAALSGMQARQGFRVGHLHLMIRYEDGSELTELPQIFRMPNAPHWMAGMVNLHGLLIPVFDLAAYLGVEHDPKARSLLLVLGHGADAAGVLIDGMPDRLRWNADDRIDTESAPSRLAAHLSAGCLIDDTLWFDLQHRSLLDALERDLGSPH